MGQIAQDLPINHDILIQCREQMGLPVASVEKEIGSIHAIEKGNKRPIYKQLDILCHKKKPSLPTMTMQKCK